MASNDTDPLALVYENGEIGLRKRFDGLRSLRPGWLDGYGLAPSHDGLAWLERELSRAMAAGAISTVHIYPSEEGLIVAEWDFGPWGVTVDFNVAARTAWCHSCDVSLSGPALDASEDVDAFDLDAVGEWRGLWAWVRRQQVKGGGK